jgi:uncharacterized integral membrane protein
MKRKLKRILYLVLILMVIVFIFDNRQKWTVGFPLFGEYEMPAYAMLVLLLGVGYLLGYLTPIWLRKRRESRATTL